MWTRPVSARRRCGGTRCSSEAVGCIINSLIHHSIYVARRREATLLPSGVAEVVCDLSLARMSSAGFVQAGGSRGSFHADGEASYRCQVVYGREAAAVDSLAGEDRKERLDRVEPAARGRREVHRDPLVCASLLSTFSCFWWRSCRPRCAVCGAGEALPTCLRNFGRLVAVGHFEALVHSCVAARPPPPEGVVGGQRRSGTVCGPTSRTLAHPGLRRLRRPPWRHPPGLLSRSRVAR